MVEAVAILHRAAAGEMPVRAEEIAAVLEQIGEQMNDARYRRAAAALLAPVGGRPQINDESALVEMDHLLDNGEVHEIQHAARLVAISIGGQSIEATEWRLAKKYRKRLAKKSADETH